LGEVHAGRTGLVPEKIFRWVLCRPASWCAPFGCQRRRTSGVESDGMERRL